MRSGYVGSKGLILALAVLAGGACAARSDPPAAPEPDRNVEAREDSIARERAREAREAARRAEEERARADSIARADSVARADSIARARVEEEARAREDAARRAELLEGSILPRRRIVAYYGNPQSERMGILGELPREQLLRHLRERVREWERADPATPVVPALHMIAVMAAGDSGRDGRYRVRMPERVIQRIVDMAADANALVFLDIQPGRSTVQAELPRLLPWLQRPTVHLALDPEWNMGTSATPGHRIGSMDASTINYAIDELAKLVEEHDLPPKILIVHRFTRDMVRNPEQIKDDPRVQVVLNMDGWGAPTLKRSSYNSFVAPVDDVYKGFKIFFKNDRRDGSRLMTPEEVLSLSPEPIYIQYQ